MSRIVALLGACALVHSAPAALLAGWETTSLTNWGSQGLAHSQKHANVTVGGLTRGGGVSTSGSPSQNGWGGKSWHAGSYPDGIDENRTITFTITPSTGYAISIDTITLHYKRSGNGPLAAGVEVKIGNGAFTELEEIQLNSDPDSAEISNWLPALSNPNSSPITFRITPYAASNSGGEFFVWNSSSTTLDLAVHGTVTGSGGGDTTPPTLIGLTPNDNATHIAVPTTLTAVFNKNIARGTGTILVKETATGEVINALDVTDHAQVSLTVNQIGLEMIHPLSPGTAYHVEIPAGAIVDLAGTPNAFAGFTDSETWNFTTLQVIDPPEVVVNKYFNGSPDRVELLVTGDGTAGSTVDMRGMILKDFSSNIEADGGGRVVFSSSPLWSAVPAGTLITLTHWALSPDVSAADFTLSVGLTDPAYFTPVEGSPEFDLNATDMVMIKEAGSDPAGTAGGIHALAAGLPPTQSLFSSFTGAKAIAATGTNPNLGVRAGNSTATLDDYMAGSDATGGLLLSLGDFGTPNSGPNAAYIAALRGRTAGQGDGVATVTNATLTSPLLGQPAFDAGQTGQSMKVTLLAQAGTTEISQASITIPAALGTPSGAVLSGPAAANANVAVNGQAIQITSAAITTSNALEVTISGLSTPATPQVSNNGIYPLAISTTGTGGTLTPLSAQAAARVTTPAGTLQDNDANGLPLDSGLVVAVSGTVTEEDFGGGAANFNGFLQDASGGISIFSPGLNLGLIRGYRFTILGTVIQTNGQTSIIPSSSSHIVNLGPVPEFASTRIRLSDLLANPEARESSLFTVANLVIDSGTWGPGSTVVLRDPWGTTIDVRIQPGSTAISAPAEPIVITGILGQADVTAPFTGNYFLMPRDAGDAVHMTDLAYWMSLHGATGGSADDDGDGHINSDEYAFGLDPRSGASSNPIVATLDRTTGKFRFTRRLPLLTGLTYRVFTSGNLSHWDHDTAATLSVIATDGDIETVEVTLGTAAPLPASALFIRVEAL